MLDSIRNFIKRSFGKKTLSNAVATKSKDLTPFPRPTSCIKQTEYGEFEELDDDYEYEPYQPFTMHTGEGEADKVHVLTHGLCSIPNPPLVAKYPKYPLGVITDGPYAGSPAVLAANSCIEINRANDIFSTPYKDDHPKLPPSNIDAICEMGRQIEELKKQWDEQESNQKYLWEILVPTEWHDADVKGEVDWESELKPVRLRHHRIWDEKVIEITGGLTIIGKVGGKWISGEGRKYEEDMIACHIQCTKPQIDEIAKFTLKHYRQKAVMYSKISSETYIIEQEENGLGKTQTSS